MNPVIATPDLGIYISGLKLDMHLLRCFMDLMEHPEKMCGLVHAATERQVLITESAAGVILGDFSQMTREEVDQRLMDATSLRRRDYFYLPDLEEFNASLLDLEPNNPNSSKEVSWRGQRRDGQWVRYTHSYRLIESMGHLYQLGTSRGVDEIPAPPELVTA